MEEKPSSSLPIKSMLYLSCISEFNESRRKLGLRKITQNVFLWLFYPSLSSHLSSVRCRGSLIRCCRVASVAAALCTAHRKTSRTGCRCKQPSCFHFCGHVRSSQGRPQPATTNTHANSHSPKGHSGNNSKPAASVVFITLIHIARISHRVHFLYL